VRYCKRTFFNRLLQPHRIGKAILYKVRQTRNHRLYIKTTMQEFRLGKTPKNLILGRYQKVRTFKLYGKLGLRTTQSIFVRRAKSYVS